ncbi:hypothetical protein NC652_022703 [Populus alba x Populus x berolinensis]|nr:hypothetical protein NC652_022703 [Populus alba x Populus x berolinensis]
MPEHTLPNHEAVICTENLENHPPGCSPATTLHSGMSENLSRENSACAGCAHKSILCSAETSNVVTDLHKKTVGDGREGVSSSLNLTVSSSEERFICKDTNTQLSRPSTGPDMVPQSNLISASGGDDKFTAVMETVEMGIQNVDVGKLLNVVGDELEMRNVSTPMALKSSNCSEAMSLKSSLSDHFSIKEIDLRNISPLVPKFDLSELPKSSAPVTEEEAAARETLDVKSFRQRAEALEGLLELSAELLQQSRLEELAVCFKTFRER